MILYQRAELVDELRRADYRLKLLMVDYAWELEALGFDLEVTSVERSRAKTLELYRRQRKPPPAMSVHEADPCRGGDGIAVPREGAEISADLGAIDAMRIAANRVNARWIYGEGRVSVLVHDIAGIHAHCQVSWRVTELLP